MADEHRVFFDFVVLGEPASKSNQRRIVRFGKVSRLIKSEKALKYTDSFKQQIQSLPLADPLDCDVALRIDFWYASRRPDLAGMDLIMDLLQGVCYLNDRSVKISASTWSLDKLNPRVRIRCAALASSGDVDYNESDLGILWKG